MRRPPSRSALRPRQIDRVNFSRAFSRPRADPHPAYYSMKFRGVQIIRKGAAPPSTWHDATLSPSLSLFSSARPDTGLGFCCRETLIRKSSITRAGNRLDNYYFKTRRISIARVHTRARSRETRALTRRSRESARERRALTQCRYSIDAGT